MHAIALSQKRMYDVITVGRNSELNQHRARLSVRARAIERERILPAKHPSRVARESSGDWRIDAAAQ